jgi:hypothetical protein
MSLRPRFPDMMFRHLMAATRGSAGLLSLKVAVHAGVSPETSGHSTPSRAGEASLARRATSLISAGIARSNFRSVGYN